jgi:hypothetical protein
MSEPGEFRNIKNTTLPSFIGLRYGTITPTDIDAVIEYHGKAFIFIEAKYKDADIPDGQRILFVRLCDALEKAGIKTVFLKASWDESLLNQDGSFDLARATVTKVYTTTTGIKTGDGDTVRKYIDRFLVYAGLIGKPKTACAICGSIIGVIDGKCETCRVADDGFEPGARIAGAIKD